MWQCLNFLPLPHGHCWFLEAFRVRTSVSTGAVSCLSFGFILIGLLGWGVFGPPIR